MTGRAVPEWIAASPDAKIPPRVRARVFERYQGRCYLTGRRIAAGEAWECDHIIALVNGGEHREGNLAPALSSEHKKKTARDVAEKSKVARIRAKHIGATKPKSRLTHPTLKRKFSGEVVAR